MWIQIICMLDSVHAKMKSPYVFSRYLLLIILYNTHKRSNSVISGQQAWKKAFVATSVICKHAWLCTCLTCNALYEARLSLINTITWLAKVICQLVCCLQEQGSTLIMVQCGGRETAEARENQNALNDPWHSCSSLSLIYPLHAFKINY